MSAKFEAGSWVWIHHDTERFLPAKVLNAFSCGEETTVLTEDGEKHKLTEAQSKLVEQCNPEALDSSIEDLVNISDLNEMSILHNLRIRFREDKIYTSISSILISVNPFKLLPLYTPAMLELYRHGSRDQSPHIFGVAINAYNNLLSDAVDQSVVISGESGAGKSEATKLILQLLTDVSARTSGNKSANTGPVTSMANTLEAQILAANPILEAFGNAKTLRNNNSSRFGKLITVNFDQKGSIIGGGIINYLLEKSRVVFQTAGERNYHIFYQLLTLVDTDPTFSEEMKLQNADLFNYTSQSGVNVVDGISDDKDFEDVQNSMNILKFSAEIQKEIFKLVAGVLHFGNVKFGVLKKSTEEDGSEVLNTEVLAHASAMWGCDPSLMEKFLTSRHIGTRSVILVGYTVQQANDARDAMVKRVYSEMFQFIVNKINQELSAGAEQRHKFIGVLDIFGFESFDVNSFEQLCINYCNEKLQFHFNEHIFKMEQSLYAAEGISIPGTAFVDNQPTLDLLEAKAFGIFSMVDEEISVPRGSDEGLLQKILQKHADGKHPNMIRPKTKDCKDFLRNFGVLHYAGPVFYNVTNFLEKNKDQLHSDIVGVLSCSSSPLLKMLFPPAEPAEPVSRVGGRGGAANKPKTLGFQFKTQLKDLIDTLEKTSPHFVRCMKSNDLKSGGIFAAGRMQDQLRYAGLVEVCRIRKLGFPVRRTFDEFYKRFRCIDLTAPDLDALVKVLSARGILHEGEWAKGHSRLFMRSAQSAELELAREESLVFLAIKVQRHVRKMISRRRFRWYMKILADLRAAIVARSDADLKSGLDVVFELPWHGVHIKVVQDARALRVRIAEENRVTALLENSLTSGDITTLQNALSMHAAMSPAFDTPLAAQATAVLEKLLAEAKLKTDLLAAMSARDRDALNTLIEKATAMSFDCDEVAQAKTFVARLEQEGAALTALLNAVEARNLQNLNGALTHCTELGMESYYAADIAKATTLQKELLAEEIAREEERKAREEEEARRRAELEAIEKQRNEKINSIRAALVAAVAAADHNAINAALQQALAENVQGEEVDSARTALENLKRTEDARHRLKACLDALAVTAKNDEGVSTTDLEPLRIVLANQDLAATDALRVQAVEKLGIYEKLASARDDLSAAVQSRDRTKLRAALDIAENLEMNITLVSTARDLLKEKAAGEAAAAAPVSAPVPAQPLPAQPYDAAEVARKLRQEIARQPRFDIKNYPNLRTADDYARGVILNKSKTKEQFLSFQATVIPKSLTDLSRDYSRLAVQLHKDLLGYMGDKQMSYPAMLAQDILRKGYETMAIRDEIYLQIVKQLTSNPRPESVAKGWQVMCMCVATFPPSPEFENFLLHYIIEKRDKGRGAVVDYARYCLRTLEAMLNNGEGSGFVPSVEEIQAFKDRPPILATICFVDGCVIAENLPITPDLNVAKVIEMCCGWIDLRDPRISTLGMFVYDMGEIDENAAAGANKPAYHDLHRTPRALRNEDYMGDVIVQKARQRRKFKFVLKRKIFLERHNERANDLAFERLTYLQAEDDAIVTGNLRFDEEVTAVQLAALSLAVAYNDSLPSTVEELVDLSVADFIPPDWRNTQTPEYWAERILEMRDDLVNVEADDLQDQFIQIVQQNPMYGSHWFYSYKMDMPSSARQPQWVIDLPRALTLAFNVRGMFIFDSNRNLLKEVPYADICRWGGSSSQFSLIMCEANSDAQYEFVLITAQAADMAAIILDHIRFIMAEE